MSFQYFLQIFWHNSGIPYAPCCFRVRIRVRIRIRVMVRVVVRVCVYRYRVIPIFHCFLADPARHISTGRSNQLDYQKKTKNKKKLDSLKHVSSALLN